MAYTYPVTVDPEISVISSSPGWTFGRDASWSPKPNALFRPERFVPKDNLTEEPSNGVPDREFVSLDEPLSFSDMVPEQWYRVSDELLIAVNFGGAMRSWLSHKHCAVLESREVLTQLVGTWLLVPPFLTRWRSQQHFPDFQLCQLRRGRNQSIILQVCNQFHRKSPCPSCKHM